MYCVLLEHCVLLSDLLLYILPFFLWVRPLLMLLLIVPLAYIPPPVLLHLSYAFLCQKWTVLAPEDRLYSCVCTYLVDPPLLRCIPSSTYLYHDLS